ncbi:hypothetical protein [Xanthomonas medicagonis]|uniref:hypothetical protein n=1 Tax=Xanthomonas medicagonis TaxID=3160841 RepID=UPI0035188051
MAAIGGRGREKSAGKDNKPVVADSHGGAIVQRVESRGSAPGQAAPNLDRPA